MANFFFEDFKLFIPKINPIKAIKEAIGSCNNEVNLFIYFSITRRLSLSKYGSKNQSNNPDIISTLTLVSPNIKAIIAFLSGILFFIILLLPKKMESLMY